MIALAAVALLLILATRAWSRMSVGRGTAVPRRWPLVRRQPPRPTAEQWATLLDAMSAEVRTGSALTAALRQAVRRDCPNGRVITGECTSLDRVADAQTTDPDEAVVVHAIAAAHALGGPVAASLNGASALLRERSAIRAEAHAYAAQARLSARVLTAVPLVFAGWSLCTSRSFRDAVLSPLGVASAAVGGLCNLFGWWWMRRIVNRAAT